MRPHPSSPVHFATPFLTPLDQRAHPDSFRGLGDLICPTRRALYQKRKQVSAVAG
ncbi:hypothetical protein CBOM_05653 [Ceraceosorus bombacis]|uniref:Uncharacterized protein n=1 Tax=Ceraceosorus bombacis TaxID=401625 RepID=A0A0P1BQP4_9BASI|nr:hypothetical protein CBOM_05653 [Ceraceosorus bombacis]